MWREPSDSESLAAVQAALRGEPIPFEASVSKMLRFMLDDERGCDAEVTPKSFIVWYVERGASPYFLSVAPGVVSFLLGGVSLPESRHVIRALGPATVSACDGFPAWAFARRYIRIDASERTMIRVRPSEAPLADLGPEIPIEGPHRFVTLDRACPHCGRIPEQYRVLTGGALVCLACGRSLDRA